MMSFFVMLLIFISGRFLQFLKLSLWNQKIFQTLFYGWCRSWMNSGNNAPGIANRPSIPSEPSVSKNCMNSPMPIITEDWPGIKEELGDLFLHLLFYARIGKEQNRFTLVEVLDGISDKLIARHPHIYGDVKVNSEEDVKQNWEKLKLKEGKKSVLSGVPASLPALVKAIRLQEKSKQVGFEWSNAGEVWNKVEEESRELEEAVHSETRLIWRRNLAT